MYALLNIKLQQKRTKRKGEKLYSEMDRDRYSGNCLFKVEEGDGEEEDEQILCGGAPQTAPSMRYPERR